ncbi:MAG TPA: helix-turn-helix transcriptional regulator [Dehalococcoidia bacterium]|nr:helix-turn-helix transcriptional regulator [Dehalococcoidia bacterium]
MTDWNEFRDQLLAENPKTRIEYERLAAVYRAIADVIRLRHLRGLSQDELARRMGKQQPSIARLEAGRVSPSLAFLEEVAEALDARLTIRIEGREELDPKVTARRRRVRA